MLTLRLTKRFVAVRPIRVVAVFLMTVAAATATYAQSTPTFRHDDNQEWTEIQVAIPLNQKTDLVLLGLVHFGHPVVRPLNERTGGGAGASFKIGKYLTLFPFYLHLDVPRGTNNRSSEERITLEGTVKFPISRFTLSERNRVEFHVHTAKPNFIHYRNRLQVEHPLGFFGLNGFLGDEVFYDSLFAAWIRNRATLGITKKVNAHFTCDVYYLRQNDGHAHPGDINALVTSLKFRL